MKTIGVFFGSRSPEHDISIITAQLILSGLKKLGYPYVPVYIGKKGEWYIGEELGTLKSFTAESAIPSGFQEYFLDLEKSRGTLVFRKKGVMGKEVAIDIAFPALHGAYGEDGTIQGLFEMFNLPYVGCDVASSAIAMDKVLTKQLCIANKLPTLPFCSFTKHEWNNGKEQVIKSIQKQLKFPMIVKPAHLGSSIAVTKVKQANDLEQALEVAFHYDDKVLIEKCVEDLLDITCALLGNDNPRPSLLQEAAFDSDIFSYDDKYLNDGGAQLGNATRNLHIPARLDEKTTKAIQNIAVRIFNVIGLSGISRVDFIYDKKSKKYFVSEINPLPGTLYHHLWKASGVELDEVITTLLHLAEEKHEVKQSLIHTFQSDLLKHAHSIKLQAKEE